ncbi:unnamed protein product, partial [Thlaspi arvense]
MGDTYLKKKNQYNQWNIEESKVLVELLVEGIKHGWCDSCGLITKLTVENKILSVLNERLGCQKTYTQYQSRINTKVIWIFNVTALGSDEILRQKSLQLLKKCGAHPNHKYMRYDSHVFEDLQIVFDGVTANGSKSVRLDDNTDAPTCRAGDDQVKETLVFCESGDDGNDASPFLDKNLKGHVEKFTPRKRSRTEACNNLKELKSDNNDYVVTRKRQQKEAERREAEKKKNSVWTKDETVRFPLSRTVEYLHVVPSIFIMLSEENFLLVYHGKCP